MIRFAQLTDVHISSPGQTILRMWTGKRIMGGMNMLLRRRHEYRNAYLPIIVEHLLEQDLDMVVVSGDLSTTSLAKEFEVARKHLQPFIDQGKLVTIPGNHDVYTKAAQKKKRYEQFFQDCHGETTGSEIYPFVRPVGEDVVFIGLGSAVPTGVSGSWGRIGEKQLTRLPIILSEHVNQFRVLLVHHFIQDKHGTPGHPRRAIRDSERLLEVVKEYGVELILHGHEHARYNYNVPGPKGDIPVYNPGPATRYGAEPSHQGGYHIYEVSDKSLKKVETYIFDPKTQSCQLQFS